MIYETLGTLDDTLRDQILVVMIVIVPMMTHLRAALLITSVLPRAVLSEGMS